MKTSSVDERVAHFAGRQAEHDRYEVAVQRAADEVREGREALCVAHELAIRLRRPVDVSALTEVAESLQAERDAEDALALSIACDRYEDAVAAILRVPTVNR